MTADHASLSPGQPLLSARNRTILLALTALGIVAFVGGLVLDATRAWSALLVNFLYWSGLAFAGVAFSAMFQATSARWARPIKRVAEATVAFLPVAGLMLVVLLAGVSVWAPWMHEPIPAKAAWLNAPFFISRELLAFLLLGGLSVAYVRASVRPDVGLLRESSRREPEGWARSFVGGWQGIETERATSQRRQGRLAVAVLIAYGYVLTLQALDFVMALDPHWFSTLAGGYFFVGNLYVGIAFLAVVLAWASSRPDLQHRVGHDQSYDIGRLLFGFSTLWAYTFWAQYLVIWYGDLPEETEFVIHRTVDAPWAPLAWVVLAMAFVIPWTLLLSKELKREPRRLAMVAGVSLLGMWLERFILVGPSLWHGEGLPLGIVEILMTAGVGASFVLCYSAFLQRVPVLPISDPLLAAAAETAHH
jgi:hypothetical protein